MEQCHPSWCKYFCRCSLPLLQEHSTLPSCTLVPCNIFIPPFCLALDTRPTCLTDTHTHTPTHHHTTAPPARASHVRHQQVRRG